MSSSLSDGGITDKEVEKRKLEIVIRSLEGAVPEDHSDFLSCLGDYLDEHYRHPSYFTRVFIERALAYIQDQLLFLCSMNMGSIDITDMALHQARELFSSIGAIPDTSNNWRPSEKPGLTDYLMRRASQLGVIASAVTDKPCRLVIDLRKSEINDSDLSDLINNGVGVLVKEDQIEIVELDNDGKVIEIEIESEDLSAGIRPLSRI